MPSRITKEKAEIIAQNYINNNCDKAKGLIASGYSHSYAHCGLREGTYNNILVKQAIFRLKAKIAAKNEITLDEVVGNARKQVDIGERKDSAADIKGGNEQLARIAGHFERDNLQKSQGVVIMIAPPRGYEDAAGRPIVDNEQ